MKKLSLILCVVWLYACTPNTKPTSDDIDLPLLNKTVSFLASDEIRGRKAGTPEGYKAANWLAEQMQELGFEPWSQSSYLLDFPIKNGVQGKNVVGCIRGKGKLAEEWIVLSAHYDHIGIKTAVDGDSIANGADDNATGVATMLALGKNCLSWIGEQTDSRSLMVIAFDAEEMGLLGSKHFVNSVLLEELDSTQVIANLNFEMLGKYAEGQAGQAFLTGSDRSNLITLLQKASEQHDWKLIHDPFPKFNLYYRSDNAAFAKRGIIAHTLSTDPIDQDSLYHSVNDEIESLDLQHTQQVAEGVLYGLKALLIGENIDPS